MHGLDKADGLRIAIRAIAQALREREAGSSSLPQAANRGLGHVDLTGHVPNSTGCAGALCARAA